MDAENDTLSLLSCVLFFTSLVHRCHRSFELREIMRDGAACESKDLRTCLFCLHYFISKSCAAANSLRRAFEASQSMESACDAQLAPVGFAAYWKAVRR